MKPKKQKQRVWPILLVFLLMVVALNPSDSKHFGFMQDQHGQAMREEYRKIPELRGAHAVFLPITHYDEQNDYVNWLVCSYTVNKTADQRATFGLFGFVWWSSSTAMETSRLSTVEAYKEK